MKTFIYSILVAVVITLSACSSDDGNGNTNPVTTDGFSWTENGSSTVKTSATATFSTQFKTFMVKDAANALVFEINLDGTAAATYALGSTNAFAYTAVNPFFIATGGNVVITSNTGGKVSGTFTATGSGGGITSITGSFTNVPIIQ